MVPGGTGAAIVHASAWDGVALKVGKDGGAKNAESVTSVIDLLI
jgi:hypothetical protein